MKGKRAEEAACYSSSVEEEGEFGFLGHMRAHKRKKMVRPMCFFFSLEATEPLLP